jgi:hypothetical protein
MTDNQREQLSHHLFPSDGLEAVAIALCGRASSGRGHRLMVRRLELIPYSACRERHPDRVTWPTSLLVPLIMEAERYNWAVVKIHGHTGYDRFSIVDDDSDRKLFPSLYSWISTDAPHASVIVMRDGRVFGRTISEAGEFHDLERVAVIGDDIRYFSSASSNGDVPDHARRIAQTFGNGTYAKLRSLRIAVIGCSGTGSPVVEQLARNCVGELVLVDPDRIEEKNLNRIVNATMSDAQGGAYKVDVAKRAIEAMGLGTRVETYARTLFDREVVQAVASCDVVIGCMDSIDGRFLLNKLSAFYLLPYFDLGVRIDADGQGGVDQVCGSVHYIKPDGSSLLSRRLFSLEQVRSAGLQRTDPGQYKKLLEEGYLRGVQEDRPAVVQLNTLIASLAVNELLARLHPYRLDPNAEYAVTRISLSHGLFAREPDGIPCPVLSRHAGRGDVEPILDWSELSKQESAE